MLEDASSTMAQMQWDRNDVFQKVIDYLDQAFLVLDHKGVLLYANWYARQHFYREEHLGRKLPLSFTLNPGWYPAVSLKTDFGENLLDVKVMLSRWTDASAYLVILSETEKNASSDVSHPPLQMLWNVLEDPVFILDNNGVILDANPAAKLQLHCSSENLLGQPLTALFIPGQQGEFSLVLHQAFKERAAIFSGLLGLREQHQFPVEILLKAENWDQGQVIFAFCRDLSHYSALEEQVDRLKGQLDEALESAFAYQWSMVTDADGKLSFRTLSSSADRVTGYPAEDFITGKKEWFSIVHPEDRSYVEDHLTQWVIGRQQESLEYRFIRPDQTVRWVQDMLETRRIIAGRVYLSGVSKDITELKRAEETRRQSSDQLLQWVNELKQRNSEATLFNEMGDLLQSCISFDEVFMVVRRFALELFSDQSGALYLYDASVNLLEQVVAWGENPPESRDFVPDDCWGLRRNSAQVANGSTDVHCKHVALDQCHSYLCVPMTVQTETLGLFHLCSNQKQPLEHLAQISLMFASRVALALSNLRLSETLRRQSIHDPLTGLYNRRYLDEMLNRELRRAIRHERPIGIIMADIDHFKDFNDQYGHAAADVVLKEVARFLQVQVRGEDIICRYGGEEFIAVLVEASLRDTEKRANLLREGIEALSVRYGEVTLGNVTISLGVSAFPQHGRNVQTLIESADNALYKAKRAGRNCVMTSD